jgi:glucokinase
MTVMEAVLGVDLGGSWVRAGKVRNGIVENNVSRRISGKETKDVVLGEVFEAIDQVVDPEISGIGFCVPSVVDVKEGVVRSVENIPSWHEVRLREALEGRYGVPAFINNDANAFAVGELHFGKGRGHRNFVGLTIGTGLGAGVVIEGRLYSGTNCGAGEVGNIPYRGRTLEDYCSGRLFLREGGIPGDILYGRACAGDRHAQDLIASLGCALGDAILILLYAYDPEMIVLGGSVSRAFAWFEAPMRERLKAYAFPHALERLEITCSEIEEVALLGAAAIYLDAALLNKTI